MKKTLGAKKIYTREVPCAICLKPVEKYPEEYQRSQTIRGWMNVCNKCWRRIEKRIENSDKKVKRLEKEILRAEKIIKEIKNYETR